MVKKFIWKRKPLLGVVRCCVVTRQKRPRNISDTTYIKPLSIMCMSYCRYPTYCIQFYLTTVLKMVSTQTGKETCTLIHPLTHSLTHFVTHTNTLIYTYILLLPLALQPTVGFGLLNNVLPFFPICHQLSPSSHSHHLKISFYFLFPSFPESSLSSRPFLLLSEDLFGHPILLHSLLVT